MSSSQSVDFDDSDTACTALPTRQLVRPSPQTIVVPPNIHVRREKKQAGVHLGEGGYPLEFFPELKREQNYAKFRTEQYRNTLFVEDLSEDISDQEEEVKNGEFPKEFQICRNFVDYVEKGITNPLVVDAQVLIDAIRRFPELGFLYLERVSSPEDDVYDPYRFRVCNFYDLTSKKNFCTISPLGFGEFTGTTRDYVPLDEFENGYHNVATIGKFKFFETFCLRKHFAFWYNKVKKEKFLKTLDKMNRRLVFRKHPHYDKESGEVDPFRSIPDPSSDSDD